MEEEEFLKNREQELHEDPSLYDEYELCETDPEDYPGVDNKVMIVSSSAQAKEYIKGISESISTILRDYEARNF